MLPRWRSEAGIYFSPRGAALRLAPRGLLPLARTARVTERRAAAPSAAGEPWRTPLAALGEAMRELPRRTSCRVVVSSAFARYALVPFSPALIDRKANEGLAAHVFRHVHGEPAESWTFRVAAAPVGRHRLACALDMALVEGIEAAARSARVTLAAIEPALGAGYNAARRRLPRTCWFAAVEPDKVSLGLLAAGAWTHLAGERYAGDWEGALERMLAREALIAPAAPGSAAPPCWIARFGSQTDPAHPEIRAFGARRDSRPARLESSLEGKRATA